MALLLSLADKMAALIGSWRFIAVQSLLLFIWVIINLFGLVNWDPYPFILLNLLLSFQAAYTGPILLMAANRQAEIDRRRAVKNLHIDMADHEVIIRLEKHLDQHFHELDQKLRGSQQNDRSLDA